MEELRIELQSINRDALRKIAKEQYNIKNVSKYTKPELIEECIKSCTPKQEPVKVKEVQVEKPKKAIKKNVSIVMNEKAYAQAMGKPLESKANYDNPKQFYVDLLEAGDIIVYKEENGSTLNTGKVELVTGSVVKITNFDGFIVYVDKSKIVWCKFNIRDGVKIKTSFLPNAIFKALKEREAQKL